MKCPKCNKPIKENTEGNKKYCQGHSMEIRIRENITKGENVKEVR